MSPNIFYIFVIKICLCCKHDTIHISVSQKLKPEMPCWLGHLMYSLHILPLSETLISIRVNAVHNLESKNLITSS